jgi:hypothetical protein
MSITKVRPASVTSKAQCECSYVPAVGTAPASALELMQLVAIPLAYLNNAIKDGLIHPSIPGRASLFNRATCAPRRLAKRTIRGCELYVRQTLTSYTIIWYRLASKQFCAIGAEELFHTLIIQHSTRSLERLEAIASTDHLRKHVKTMYWDTNLWKVQHVDDLHEWENYFTKKATYYQNPYNFQKREPSALDSVLSTQCMSLSNNRGEWDAYLDKVSDEEIARKSYSQLLAVFAKFRNMQTIHVCNGTLVRSHRGLDKVDDCMYRPPEQPTLRRGEGVHDWNSHPSLDAFATIRFIPGLLLKELRLDRVHFLVFRMPVTGDFSKLTTLNLKITICNDYTRDYRFRRLTDITRSRATFRQGHLREFLDTLQHLECLRLDLDSTHENMWGHRWFTRFRESSSSISDILGLDSIWPKLRTLSLCHFFASSESMLSLLQRHSSTLKDLSLCNINLDKNFEVMDLDEYDRYENQYENAQGSGEGAKVLLSVDMLYCSWPLVLQTLRESLVLERATISGLLGVKCQ